MLLALAMFVSDRIRPDAVALIVLLLAWLTGLVSLEEALAGFGSPAVLIVAAVLVVGRAVEYTGAAQAMTGLFVPKSRFATVRIGGVLADGRDSLRLHEQYRRARDHHADRAQRRPRPQTAAGRGADAARIRDDPRRNHDADRNPRQSDHLFGSRGPGRRSLRHVRHDADRRRRRGDRSRLSDGHRLAARPTSGRGCRGQGRSKRRRLRAQPADGRGPGPDAARRDAPRPAQGGAALLAVIRNGERASLDKDALLFATIACW